MGLLGRVQDNLGRYLFHDRLDAYEAEIREAWSLNELYRRHYAYLDDDFWDDDGTERRRRELTYSRYLTRSVSVYACVRLRSIALSALPLKLYRKLPDGTREQVNEHPLLDLLARPNPWLSNQQLKFGTESALCLWGESFWVAERGRSGLEQPYELQLVPPEYMSAQFSQERGVKYFEYTQVSNDTPRPQAGTGQRFDPREVVWLRYPHPENPYIPLSPLAAARRSLILEEMARASNTQFFEQGMMPGGIISPLDERQPPLTDSQAAQIQSSLDSSAKGLKNAHRWTILRTRVGVQELSSSPKDADFLGLLQQCMEDICRVLGVPALLVGDLEHGDTYRNKEHAERAFWANTMRSEAHLIAEQLNLQLVPMFDEPDLLLAFDLDGVSALREDENAIVERMRKLGSLGEPLNAMLAKWFPDLLPADGTGWPWGDEPWLPGTLVQPSAKDMADDGPADDEPDGDTDDDPEADADDMPDDEPDELDDEDGPLPFGSPRHQEIIDAFHNRAARGVQQWRAPLREYFDAQEQQVLAALRASRMMHRRGVDDNPFDRQEAALALRLVGQPLITESFQEAGLDALAAIGGELDFDLNDPAASAWLRQRSQRFARRVTDTTWNRLRDTLGAGMDGGESIDELSERVTTIYSDARGRRARMIARTEVVAASNAGALEGASQSGVMDTKTWVSALDERVRPSHARAHGQTVGLKKYFRVGGARGPAPGQMGSGREDIQCRCTITFGVSTTSAGQGDRASDNDLLPVEWQRGRR